MELFAAARGTPARRTQVVSFGGILFAGFFAAQRVLTVAVALAAVDIVLSDDGTEFERASGLNASNELRRRTHHALILAGNHWRWRGLVGHAGVRHPAAIRDDAFFVVLLPLVQTRFLTGILHQTLLEKVIRQRLALVETLFGDWLRCPRRSRRSRLIFTGIISVIALVAAAPVAVIATASVAVIVTAAPVAVIVTVAIGIDPAWVVSARRARITHPSGPSVVKQGLTAATGSEQGQDNQKVRESANERHDTSPDTVRVPKRLFTLTKKRRLPHFFSGSVQAADITTHFRVSD